MIETLIAETWLKSVLSVDAELHLLVAERIYSYLAPRKAPYPLVVYDLSPGRESKDAMGVGAIRIMSDLVYAVRAIGETESFKTLWQIAERLDKLLHKTSGQVFDAYEQVMIGEIPFRLVSNEVNIVEAIHYTFQVQEQTVVENLQLYCKAVGSPIGDLRVGFYEDNEGDPGTEIASQTVDSVSTEWELKDVAISATLEAATPYWLVIDQTGVQDASNYYVVNISEIPFDLASDDVIVPVGDIGSGAIGVGKELETVRCTFQLQGRIAVAHLQLYCKMVGNPAGSLRIGLYRDSQGEPGTEIASQTVDGLGTEWAWKDMAISATLEAATTYWLVIDQTGTQDASNYYVVNAGDTGTHIETTYAHLVGKVLSCVRLAPLSEVEIGEQDGRVFRHLGGVYQIQVQKT